MSSHDCQAFREQALEQVLDGAFDANAAIAPRAAAARAGCEACSAWLRRQELELGLLQSLERLVAPASLGERVNAGFEPDLSPVQARLAEALTELPRIAAPAALDALVRERLEADADREVEQHADGEVDELSLSVRHALAGLPSQKAPDVLARLVAEELEQGSKATARRAVRELERQAPPPSLARRLKASTAFREPSDQVSGPSRAFAPLAAAGLALVGLAAAALILFPRATERPAGGNSGGNSGGDSVAGSNTGAAPDSLVLTGFEARLAADEWSAASSRGERGLAARGIEVRRLDDFASVGPGMQSLVAAFAGPFHDASERPIAPSRRLREGQRAMEPKQADPGATRDDALDPASDRLHTSPRRDVGRTGSQG